MHLICSRATRSIKMTSNPMAGDGFSRDQRLSRAFRHCHRATRVEATTRGRGEGVCQTSAEIGVILFRPGLSPGPRACHLFRSPRGRRFLSGSERGVLLCPGRLCGVEFPVALFDAASPFVSCKDDADVVWASAFACSGDFLLRFAGCQGKDLIPQRRRATLASRFSGCSALAPPSSRWSGSLSFRGRHFS